MDISIFLAKAIGIYFIIVSLGMLINGRHIKPLIKGYLKSPAVSFLGGFLALIIGVLMVLSHNIWTLDWRVVVTLMGWSSLLKGVLWGLFPQLVTNSGKKWLESNMAYITSSLFTLVIGIFLTYSGYMH